MSLSAELNYLDSTIKEYMDEYRDKSTVEKGNAFLSWILRYIFDKTTYELEENDLEDGVLICDGTNDNDIDASFIENDRIIIIQGKYNTAHDISKINSFVVNIEQFLLSGPSNGAKPEIFQIYNSLRNMDIIEIFYITNNIFSNFEKNKITKLKEKFNKHVQDNNHYNLDGNIRLHILDLEGINDYRDELLNLVPRRIKGKKTNLLLERYFNNKEHTTVIAEVTLKELARFVDKDKDYLFYSNIRNFLGRNKINKEIEKTFHNSPKDFWYFNNGITIVCDNYEIQNFNGNGALIKIQTPQIVNGCQTANTIYSAWSRMKECDRNKQEGTILVKIIKDTNNKRADITRYTNSQTAVTGKDFFALEEFHRQLKDRFFHLGYNYEIQRKARPMRKPKGNEKYKYLFDDKFNKKNTIFAKDVVQTFAAGIHLMPAKARTIGNFVPGGRYYGKIFNDDNTPIDPRYYFFPYAIMYYSKNVLNHKNDNKLKSANLLFISFYFRILLEVFKRLRIVDNDKNILMDEKQQSIIIDSIDKIFIAKNINLKLIKTTEDTLKLFFKDSGIKKRIKDNLPKFLKSTIESDEDVKSIIRDKIKDAVDEIDIEKIKLLLENNL